MSAADGVTTLSRRVKALTLVPLAALCGLWTASLMSGGAGTALASATTHHTLPGGGSVPARAIRVPANLPVRGSIAPAVPQGAAGAVVANAASTGIPAVALTAYQRAAQIINAADPSCNMPWELIAAIGRVESDNGMYDGNHLTSKGIDVPGIYGPVLNGQNGTEAIRDTDGGVLDHNTTWDRAVGPMQFLPSTWRVVGVDADGDGQKNPQDINDASLAAAVYLCSGNGNLATRSGQQAAVFRYNHSTSYVDLVLSLMNAYSRGNYTAVPSGAYGGGVYAPSVTSGSAARSTRGIKLHQPHLNTGGGSRQPTSGSHPSKGSHPSSGPTSSPPPPTSSPKPTSNPTKKVTKGVKKVTKPAKDVLDTTAKAAAFCQAQFNNVSDPTGLLNGAAVSACAAKVKGDTTTVAAQTIPNDLAGILKWLGLPAPPSL